MHTTKTDLRLLLECLKYQMQWPGSQKQALLTIISICKKNDQFVEFFKEIGGITFIYNLSKSTSFSQVKETAIFTLASFAELHGSCKQALCREEIFLDFAGHLEENISLTEKRVVVYLLSVLVANNSRHNFPGANDSFEQLQLWTSVSSALCSSVNNPQNEENQNTCMQVFPLIKTWLQDVALSRAALAQPICSFIGMTVANNLEQQVQLLSSGGLPVMISLLTEASDEEIRKAAMFVLHTCKRI
ncbi:hypothetical protein DNTS_016542, partial [Danionella cerebrum]